MQPLAYVSRALAPTEQRYMYAQIEKEVIAVTSACEHFQHYLLGLKFTIETDHKPLVLSIKSLDEMPIRIQRFRLQLMRYSYSIVHIPGTSLHTADTLSRAPVSTPSMNKDTLRETVQAYVNLIVTAIPSTPEQLEKIKTEQDRDEVCKKVKQFVRRHGQTTEQ